MSQDFIEERVNDYRLEVIHMYFQMETGLIESVLYKWNLKFFYVK